jgi:branched-chain amino acid transport system permease protein
VTAIGNPEGTAGGRFGPPCLGMTAAGAARVGAPLAAATLLVGWALPTFLSHYWLFLLTGGVISIPIMQSLGVITGRVGVMSLCQLSFAMVGAWVTGWCNVRDVPGGFPVWMILAGLAAVPAGLVLGFPALRLRGVNLAITTFAFATALDVVFASRQFPGADTFDFVKRPAAFASDGGYFQFVVIVVALVFAGLHLVDRSRLGASWLELRHSERGAAAHGTNVATSKLAAFATSAFIAGLGGALLVGQVGLTTPAPFTAQTSLFYFAIAVTIGVRYWDAAVIAGLLGALLPVLLDAVHVPQDAASVAFGILAVLILARGRGQMGQSEIIRARRQARQARPAPVRSWAPPGPSPTGARGARTRGAGAAGAPALELRGVTVRFGAVVAVDDVSLALPRGSVVALIGPNGAGKSTLINAATGFVRASGQVLLDGRPLDGLPPHRRARRGIRRSFQQLRVPPALTAGMFLATAAGRRLGREETREYLDWFGCPSPDVPIATMDVGTRRLLEVAGLAAGRPSVLLLDEPAAGQGAREAELLSRRISEIPERTGSTVLLVEHDINLVRAACDSLVVMDFGRVIASGPPDAILGDPRVVAAYLGTGSRIGGGQLTRNQGGV